MLEVEKAVEEDGETDEAAERNRIEQAEPPGVALAQDLAIVGQRLRRRLVRAVLGEDDEDDRRENDRNQGEAEDGVPAEPIRQDGAEQRGQCGPAVAGAG